MAKAKRRTLQELLDVNINRLTRDSIKEYTKVAAETVNRTAKRWESREFKSPAFYGLEKSGGAISFKGKDTLQQMKKELARAINFLNDPTRTVKGWNTEKERQVEKINIQIEKSGGSGGMTAADYDRFYTAFVKAAELNPDIETEDYKYNIMDALIEEIHADEAEGLSADELALKMDEKFWELYEERQGRVNRESFEDISEEY